MTQRHEASWHFGYNCTNYLPTLGKCRVLIQLYNKRHDLVVKKWLNTSNLLLYTGSSQEELVDQILRGDIEMKRRKDGSLVFGTPASWAWDDCPLAPDTGGQCLHFEPHDGQKITCIMDLEHLDAEHPNVEDVPSQDAVELFEARLKDVPASVPVEMKPSSEEQ